MTIAAIENDGVAIGTGLFSNIAKEICDSVLGQLSDGMWENSPSMDKYWKFAHVKRNSAGEVVIVVSSKSGEREYYSKKTIPNGFYGMTACQVKEFFAKKIKHIAKEELKDNSIADGWDRHNNLTTSVYLSHNEKITMAHVYYVYEHLLGRACSSKYDNAILTECLGQTRSQEDIAKIDAAMSKLTEVETNYATKRNSLTEAMQKEIEAIKAKYNASLNKIDIEYHAEVTQLSELIDS